MANNISSSRTLHYALDPRGGTITLDLYEAEFYAPAIVVQSLIGNLVSYSNHGRYEPRIAKSWERVSPTTWVFDLQPGYTCEDGEKITAEEFKRSIQISLKKIATKGDFPVLGALRGFKDFLNGVDDLEGIKTDGNKLIFEFSKPVRDGLVQVLSFAPFGYIASQNRRVDGAWKDKFKFISSGPYRVASIADDKKKFVLVRRPEWQSHFAKSAPETLEFTLEIPKTIPENEAWIVDSPIVSKDDLQIIKKFPLVPEYLNAVVLGNLKKGYFSEPHIRMQFKRILERHRSSLPNQWEEYTRSRFFYPNQSIKVETTEKSMGENLPVPRSPLIIQGSEPKADSPRPHVWKVLRAALEEARLPFQFANNSPTWKNAVSDNYDIRMRSPSVGGGAEGWGLNVLFCSELGSNLPDPSGKVCNLIEAFEREKISEQELADRFVEAVDSDAAIIPISHYGIQLYLSDKIKRESLSPALSIIRFDQLEIEDD